MDAAMQIEESDAVDCVEWKRLLAEFIDSAAEVMELQAGSLAQADQMPNAESLDSIQQAEQKKRRAKEMFISHIREHNC
jgi:hypothetical protein